MDKWKFTKKINKSGVDGFRKIGIPRRRWRLFRFKECERLTRDRIYWKMIVYNKERGLYVKEEITIRDTS